MIVGGAVRGFIFIGFVFWYSTGILRVINDYFRKEFNVYIKDELKNIQTLKYTTKPTITTTTERKPFEMEIFDNEQCHVNEIIQSNENDLIENSIASCTSSGSSSSSAIDDISLNDIDKGNHKILITNNDNSMRNVMVDELQHNKVQPVFDIQMVDAADDKNILKSNDADEITCDIKNNVNDVDNQNGNRNWREMKTIQNNHNNNDEAKVLHRHNWYGNTFDIENSNDRCIDMEMEQHIILSVRNGNKNQ